ncbi:hypothetical protein GF373_16955, partial [bacterium]|nr:hypothetical protein [bacterium]
MCALRILACFAILVIHPSFSTAQTWVDRTHGSAPGDSGPRIDAIVLREMLNIYRSPARLPSGARVSYNHPSMLCQTRKKTLIFMWNGGPSEGESQNRIFTIRKPHGADVWSVPMQLEDQQIDFGTIYQPKKENAPIIAGYWLGPPPRSGTRMMFSKDDGRTWSNPLPFPKTDDPFWAGPPANGHLRFSMNPPIEFPDGCLWWSSERYFDRSLAKAVPAIVVMPSNNHVYNNKEGDLWTSLHPPEFEQGGGFLGDFLVLSPDYMEIMYLMRSGKDYVTRDKGESWKIIHGTPKDGAAGMPGAGLAALSLDVDGGPAQGWHVLASSKHPHRKQLFIRISNNPTKPGSWKHVLTLHEDIPAEDADPSMIQTADRKIHVLFTGRGSQELKHYVLDPDELIANRPPAKTPDTWPKTPTHLRAQFLAKDKVRLTWEDRAN